MPRALEADELRDALVDMISEMLRSDALRHIGPGDNQRSAPSTTRSNTAPGAPWDIVQVDVGGHRAMIQVSIC